MKHVSKYLNELAWLSFLTVCFVNFYFLSFIQVGIVGFALAVAYFAAIHLGLFNRFLNSLEDNSGTALVLIITTGFIVRWLWLILVPPVQTSDFLDYWEAAVRLAETGSYYYTQKGHILLAWRPVGYPAFLALAIHTVGENPWIPAVTNCLCYILTCLATYRIAVLIATRVAGIIAVSILSLWPSLIFMTGIAATEPLSLLLFTAAFWAFLEARQKGWGYAVLAGVLTGYGALVKPAIIMIPSLWALYHMMDRGLNRKYIYKSVIAIIGMILIISPWAYRNYTQLNAFIPVSSNGGSVFYRANNPEAWGGYSRQGERSLDPYLSDEVLWSKTGMKWGKEWIIQNPIDFLSLAIKKQGLLLREDITGLYSSMEMNENKPNTVAMILVKLSRAWWIAVIVLCTISAVKHRAFFSTNAVGGVTLWMTLFFVVVHSVFESQARYHMPMIALLSIIASLPFVSRANLGTNTVNRKVAL